MQRILYLLVYSLVWLISLLPFWLLYFFADVLYFLTYYIIGYRKRVIKDNLRLVFPKKSEAEINQIAKKFVHHLSDMVYETIKIITISEAEIKKRMKFKNVEILNSYFENNRSILLTAGHYGNWEWTGILNKLMPHDGLAVYKSIDNVSFDALVKNIRGKFGAEIVSNKKIAPYLYRKMKKGEPSLTLILTDQTPKLNAFKYRDDFMGINVPMFTGAEELAKKLDFAVFFLKVEKVKRGYYEATLVPIADKPEDYLDFEITRLFFDKLEYEIRAKPEFYLWSHKRWKHRN